MKKFLSLALLFVLLSFTSCAVASETVPGDVIVVLKNQTGSSIKASNFNAAGTVSAVQAFVEDSNVTLKQTYPALSEAGNNIFMVVHSDTKSEYELLEEFRKRPDVKAVSLNHKVRLMSREPNDPEYYRQWALQTIKAPEVWSSNTGSADVYVIVIDTGVDINHEDLKDNIAFEYCRNFTGYTANSGDIDTEDYGDVNNHGSHCAGIIAAVGNNGKGVSGVNWKTKIIALRTFNANGSGDNADTLAAVNYAASLIMNHPELNIASVNLSLGSYSSEPPSARTEDDAAWLGYKALSNLNKAVICVAAGNEELEVGVPAYRTRYYTDGSTEYAKGSYCYPASFIGIENMLVVAASTNTNTLAYFSNFSRKHVQVASPGNDIFSTIRSNISQDTTLDSYPITPYANMSGTSMATPYVAGVCAILRSIFPDATANEIKNAVIGGANGDYLRDDGSTMYGLLDLNASIEFMRRNREANAAPVIADFKIPEPVINQLYLFEFTASGAGPITYTLDGDLPAGMAFDNGFLIGIPTSITNGTFTITAENSYGSDSKTFEFNVSKGTAPIISEILSAIPEIYIGGGLGGVYLFSLAATGSYPVMWEMTSSSIPDGEFIFSESGGIILTPRTAGTYEFTVTAANSAGSDTKTFSFTVREPQAPVIEAKTLKGGVTGMKYGVSSTSDIIGLTSNDGSVSLNETIRVSGTVPFSSFDITAGKLPEGLRCAITTTHNVFNQGTIVIAGTPKEEGTFPFTFTVSNIAGTATQNFSITVSGGKPEFAEIPSGKRLVMPLGIYSETSAIYAAGKAPMEISISKGTLPKGTELKKGNLSVLIAGTPTETGSFDLTLEARNDEGTDTTDITVYVSEQALFMDSVLPDGKKNESYNYTIRTVNNVAGTFTSGNLPDGLTISRSGTISGVPSVSGIFKVKVELAASDASRVRTFALNIKDNGSSSDDDHSTEEGPGSPGGGCNVSSCALYLSVACVMFIIKRRS